MRTTNIVGLKLLKRLYEQNHLPYQPHIIYLESAHEAEEIYTELNIAWSVVPCGGLLFGDDWGWPAVKNDVLKFAKNLDIAMFEHGPSEHDKVFVKHKQWILKKLC